MAASAKAKFDPPLNLDSIYKVRRVDHIHPPPPTPPSEARLLTPLSLSLSPS